MTVGWTRSRWPWSSAGIEYESVRTTEAPVCVSVKMVKFASKSALACFTLVVKLIQSPAGDVWVGVMLFFANQS